MGATEEVGKAAGGIIDALKSSPLLLVILILNIALLVLLFYSERQHTARTKEVTHFVERIIAHCLPGYKASPQTMSIGHPQNPVVKSKAENTP